MSARRVLRAAVAAALAAGCAVGAIVGATVSAAGCGDVLPAAEPFASPRILAIAADPPVLFTGPQGIIELIPLVIDGAGNDITGDPRLELSWRLCNPWAGSVDPLTGCADEDASPLPFVDAREKRRALLSFPMLRAAFPLPGAVPDEAFDRGEGACPQEPGTILVPVVLEVRIDGYRLLALKQVPLDRSVGRYNPIVERVILESDPTQEGDTLYFGSGRGQRVELRIDAWFDAVCTATVVHAYLSDGDVDPPRLEAATAYSDWIFSLEMPEGEGATLWLVVTNLDTGGVGWRRVRLEPRAP